MRMLCAVQRGAGREIDGNAGFATGDPTPAMSYQPTVCRYGTLLSASLLSLSSFYPLLHCHNRHPAFPFSSTIAHPSIHYICRPHMFSVNDAHTTTYNHSLWMDTYSLHCLPSCLHTFLHISQYMCLCLFHSYIRAYLHTKRAYILTYVLLHTYLFLYVYTHSCTHT